MTVDVVEEFEVVDPDSVRTLAERERHEPKVSFWAQLRVALVPSTDGEFVMVLGLGMLAGGLAMVAVALALIVPGAVLVAVALGFRFERRSG